LNEIAQIPRGINGFSKSQPVIKSIDENEKLKLEDILIETQDERHKLKEKIKGFQIKSQKKPTG